MRKKLILITNEFPFGYGEPYLESELPYLAERFEDIIIVPINANGSEYRKIPKNVTISLYLIENEVISSLENVKLHLKGLGEFTKEILVNFKSFGILPRRSMYYQLLDFLKKGSAINDFLKKLIDNKAYSISDTVIYSYWAAHSAVAVAMLKKERPNLFVISRAHGWDVYFERVVTNYIPLRPFILQKIDKLYPVSAQGAYYLNTKLGFKFQNKIEARNLGVQIPELETSSKVECADLHLVSCARLVGLKRINLIVEALKELRKSSTTIKIHWTHLGGGPLYNTLKKDIEEVLIGQQQITYEFKGDIANKTVFSFYKHYQVDMFLSTSEWEGLPVSIMEAASFSIPIIATDVGGVSEIVRDGRNGWLISKDLTGTVLAKVIEKWIGLPEGEKEQFRLQSQQVAKERFSAEKNYRDWTDEIISS